MILKIHHTNPIRIIHRYVSAPARSSGQAVEKRARVTSQARPILRSPSIGLKQAQRPVHILKGLSCALQSKTRSFLERRLEPNLWQVRKRIGI